ncbi:hypothetical protein SISSUDRAFT_1038766, partial [Sistotremastrum suecicum HHB10207 ss-3]
TGFSPYFLLYGMDPVLPFDLTEATYLVHGFRPRMRTDDLLALRIRQLEKKPKDIEKAATIIRQSRYRSKRVFERTYATRLRREDYQPGQLVLVRNSPIEDELDRKHKPRYMGPYTVERQTQGGSYVLSEQNGAISRRGVAAFRLLPYHSRTFQPLPPDELGLGDPIIDEEDVSEEEEDAVDEEEDQSDEDVDGVDEDDDN